MNGEAAKTDRLDFSKAKTAADNMGCTIKEVVELGGEFEKAPEDLFAMFEAFDKNMEAMEQAGRLNSSVAVKFAFHVHGASVGLYGALCVVFDSVSDERSEIYWAGVGKMPTGFSAALDRRSFCDKMGSFNGEYKKSVCLTLRSHTDRILDSAALKELADNYTPELGERVERELFSIFGFLPRKPVYTFEIEKFK